MYVYIYIYIFVYLFIVYMYIYIYTYLHIFFVRLRSEVSPLRQLASEFRGPCLSSFASQPAKSAPMVSPMSVQWSDRQRERKLAGRG